MSVVAPGHVLGGWTLRERIGRGGMGEVWLGERDDERAAVKIMFARPDRREAAVRRFEREVRAAARIGHAGIVRVHDFGADAALDGAMYIVMELLEGTSFRSWLRRASTPRDQPRDVVPGLELLSELLEALAAAHSCVDDSGALAPIIHRDLKPENVFVLDPPDGDVRVKLLDFGIARQAGEAQVTDTGVGMGTAAYMSPEQATDARAVGTGSDVWSFGVMLYELIAGVRPFDAPSRNEVISQILTTDPVPLDTLAPGIPRRLAKLVKACLAKEPKRRPKDASMLAEELAQVLGDPGARAALSTLEVEVSLERASPHVDVSTFRPGETTRDVAPEVTAEGLDAVPKMSLAPLAMAVGLTLVGAALMVLAAWPTDEPEAPEPGPIEAPEPDAGPAPTLPGEDTNRWVRVNGGVEILGTHDDPDDDVSGFRPAADVRAPRDAYWLQQHEVTWGELEPFLADSDRAQPDLLDDPPPWLPATPAGRSRFPATGVEWTLARDFCASLGGALPSEEQWEHATRGTLRRAYAWGDEAPDPGRTQIGPREDAHPVEVMSRDQDRTPGAAEESLWDLTGNAREWTLGLFRDGEDGDVGDWASSGGQTFRAVRGLPLLTASRWRPPPSAPAAHRVPLCATGDCPSATRTIRADVGFRCAHP